MKIFLLVKTPTESNPKSPSFLGNSQEVLDKARETKGGIFHLSEHVNGKFIPQKVDGNFNLDESLILEIIGRDPDWKSALEWRNRYLAARVKYLEGRIAEKAETEAAIRKEAENTDGWRARHVARMAALPKEVSHGALPKM